MPLNVITFDHIDKDHMKVKPTGPLKSDQNNWQHELCLGDIQIIGDTL